MPATDDRILDAYLEDLRHEIQASPEEEQEILDEIRCHLWHAARDRSSEDTAVTTSDLERFGDARSIGEELRQVHGRAKWREIAWAGLPLLLLTTASALSLGEWIPLVMIAGPVAGLAGWTLYRQSHWPTWGWAWLGCLPLVIPSAPPSPLWGALAYLVILLILRNRDWMDGTLALYPLPTFWAFHRTVLLSNELQAVPWSTAHRLALSACVAAGWMILLARTLRTPSSQRRIVRALEGQIALFCLSVATIIAARLWPSYPSPYPFSLQYMAMVTLPYGLFNGLPYLLFMMLTSLPALSALVRDRIKRQQPPSQPLVSN